MTLRRISSHFSTFFQALSGLLTIAVCASNTSAQTTTKATLQPGEWRTYTSMRNVQDVALSADSNSVWVATAGGAFKAPLTGDASKTLSLHNTEGLSDDSISAVATDPNGNVYLGGFAGTFDIYSEQTGTVEQLRDIAIKDAFTIKTINAIRIFGQRVYLCTGYGLTIFNRQTSQFAETVTKFASLQSQEAVSAVLETGGITYAVLPDSVAFASTNSLSSVWKTIPGTSGVLHAIELFRGGIYVGSDSGLFLLDVQHSQFKRVSLSRAFSVMKLGVGQQMSDSLEHPIPGLFLLDSLGETVGVTRDGVNFIFYSPAPTLSSGNHLVQMAFGKASLKVFGTATEGVIIQPPSVAAIPNIFPPGPVSNSIADLSFSSTTGKLYSAHFLDGASVFDHTLNTWKDLSTSDNALPLALYLSIFYDSVNKAVWLGSSCGGPNNGLYKVTGIDQPSPSITLFAPPALPATQDPGCITIGHGMLDSHGNFLITTWAFSGQGLCSTSDGKTFTPLAAMDGSHSYGDVAEDQDGNYWVGTQTNGAPTPFGVFGLRAQQFGGGVAELPGGTGAVLPRPEVNAVIVDQDDGLWCGTNAGVEIISNISDIDNSLTPTFQGRSVPILLQQVVHCIVVDGVNNKWVGTDNGVFVVSADGSDSIAHFTTVNSPLVSNSVLAIALDAPNGEAYLGTPSGISRVSTIYKEGTIDYSSLHVYPNPIIQSSSAMPQIYITGLVGASTVKIYTVAGRLIATIDGTNLGSTVTWDGLESTGRQVSSGVYIVSATSAQTNQTGQAKFAIVRKP